MALASPDTIEITQFLIHIIIFRMAVAQEVEQVIH